MANGEKKVLESWKLKLGLLAAVVAPTITATGAYFRLDSKISESQAVIGDRVSAIELEASRSFADKSDLKEIQRDIKQMREDIVEIKTILKRRQ